MSLRTSAHAGVAIPRIFRLPKGNARRLLIPSPFARHRCSSGAGLAIPQSAWHLTAPFTQGSHYSTIQPRLYHARDCHGSDVGHCLAMTLGCGYRLRPQGTFASLQGAVAPALPSYYNYCLLVMSPLQSRYFSTFSSFLVESFCEKTDFLSFSTRFIHRSFTTCGFFFVIFPGHEVVFPLVAVSFCV